MTKTCTKCKIEKAYTEFSVDSRALSGLQTRCRECQREVKSTMKDYYRECHLRNKYGISQQIYENMLHAQEECCAICGIHEKHCEHQRLAVDHDHVTGQVRALLCKKCNQGIGLLQDSSDIASKAVDYLKEHGR